APTTGARTSSAPTSSSPTAVACTWRRCARGSRRRNCCSACARREPWREGSMNIAVFLPNWIGDAVMATPALRALRNHFRTARFVGVLKPYVAGVLEGGDWFDELLLTNGPGWSQ